MERVLSFWLGEAGASHQCTAGAWRDPTRAAKESPHPTLLGRSIVVNRPTEKLGELSNPDHGVHV